MCAPRRTLPPTRVPSRSGSPALRNGVVVGAGIRGAFGRRDLRNRSGGERGRRGLAASRRRIVGRSSCRRPCRLGASGPAAGARRQTALSRFAGAHGLGDALEAEDRSHRLSLPRPPLHRSRSRIPIRLARRNGRIIRKLGFVGWRVTHSVRFFICKIHS